MEYDDSLKLQEYETLRQEILQNKKYLFERPLLIVSAAIALTSIVENKELFIFVPPIICGLLLINFRFTIDRLRSLARIAVYQRLVLEPDSAFKWIGWENSLREYLLEWYKKRPDYKKIEITATPSQSPLFSAPVLLHFSSAVLLAFASIGMAIYFDTCSATKHANSCLHPMLIPVSAALTIALTLAMFASIFPPKAIRHSFEIENLKWKKVLKKDGTSKPA